MMHKLLLTLLAITIPSQLYTNTCYFWVFFKPKPEQFLDTTHPSLSPFTIHKRLQLNLPVDEKDYPVPDNYLNQLKKLPAIKVIGTSRWLNAAFISLPCTDTTETLKRLLSNPAVNHIRRPSLPSNWTPTTLTPVVTTGRSITYKQNSLIQVDKLHTLGYTGKGIRIAIIDAGFAGMDTISFFQHLFDENRIVFTWNVPDNTPHVWGYSTHGTMVASLISAKKQSVFTGTAPDATLLLFRTEVVDSERLVEEFYWIRAAEMADSIGVHIINTSLGYFLFDNPQENHSYQDMDGNTTPISIAADIAASKGILVVVSAGNWAQHPWKYISAPADADSVLTVGAVDLNGIIAPFSSPGPTADGRIKPDVVAPGMYVIVVGSDGNLYYGAGTSFSAPMISGLAACLWQSKPDASAMEILEAIRLSSNRANAPDTLYGWGIPNGLTALKILQLGIPWTTQINPFPNPQSTSLRIHGWKNTTALLLGITPDGKVIFSRNLNIRAGGTYVLNLNTLQQNGLSWFWLIPETNNDPSFTAPIIIFK